MVRRWKQEKEITRVIVKDKDDEVKAFEERNKAFKLERQKEETKRQVMEYREAKGVKKMRDQERQDYDRRMSAPKQRFVSSEQRQRIKQKEDEALEKRKQLISAKNERTNQREIRERELKEKIPKKYSGVVSKLDQETANVLTRQRDKFVHGKDTGKYANSFGQDMVRNAGRGVAGWRAGM